LCSDKPFDEITSAVIARRQAARLRQDISSKKAARGPPVRRGSRRCRDSGRKAVAAAPMC
jgi:hypothetical protein